MKLNDFLQTPAALRSICAWEYLDPQTIKLYLGNHVNPYSLTQTIQERGFDLILVTANSPKSRKEQGWVILRINE